MLKKSTSGPDIGFGELGRIDLEAGAVSPVAKRTAAFSPAPHGAPPPPRERAPLLSASPAPGGAFALTFAPAGAGAGPGGGGGARERERRARGLAAAAGVCYVISSAALILLNKKVLVHYNFTSVHTLLFFHCL